MPDISSQIYHLELQHLKTDVLTLSLGPTSIKVYTHGSTNEMHHSGVGVTAQRPLDEQLVNFWETWKQRGANPFMGPMAGEYNSELISQPGPKDIHGVFCGVPWDVVQISDNGTDSGYVELFLPAERWKTEIIEYYYTAVTMAPIGSEKNLSLTRFLAVVERRFGSDKSIMDNVNFVRGNLKIKGGNVRDAVTDLVNLVYPGNVDLRRRLTIKQNSDSIVTFLDEVWFKNISDQSYMDASGFHPYWNLVLSEIVNPPWGEDTPELYNENLPDVKVRELDQQERLGRTIFIVPEGELLRRKSNHIIFKDPETVEKEEVAVEMWRQKGDADHFPKISRIIKPGETSHIGMSVILVTGPVPQDLRDYVEEVNAVLATTNK